jgi:ketosteroid isomerase-like protein
MREETAEVVCVPMAPTSRSRRRLVERLAILLPRFVSPIAAFVWRLPARMRRALVERFLRIGWDAFNRQDLDAAFFLYHPDCECDWDPRFPSVGIPSTIHGREDRMRVQRRIAGEWRDMRFNPQELIFNGDRVISVGRMTGVGLTSGVPVEVEWVADLTIRAGRVVHERITMDHAEGLAAAGLAQIEG